MARSEQGGRCQSSASPGLDRNSRPCASSIKMGAKSALLFCCNVIIISYVSSATTYDQRQTGGLNVQVDLKNLRIIALMKSGKEEYVDYDYAYDYSEMTIKPQNGTTTPKPLNVTTVGDTIKDNSTEPAVVTDQTTFFIKNNNSLSLEGPEITSFSASDTSTTVKNLDSITITPTEIAESWSTKDSTFISSNPQTATPSNKCKKGFSVNQKGDCELKLQGAGNALLKLVKLSQKLKLRREDKSNEEDSSA